MKHLNKLITTVVLLVGLLSQAQDANNPWYLSFLSLFDAVSSACGFNETCLLLDAATAATTGRGVAPFHCGKSAP